MLHFFKGFEARGRNSLSWNLEGSMSFIRQNYYRKWKKVFRLLNCKYKGDSTGIIILSLEVGVFSVSSGSVLRDQLLPVALGGSFECWIQKQIRHMQDKVSILLIVLRGPLNILLLIVCFVVATLGGPHLLVLLVLTLHSRITLARLGAWEWT